MDRIQRYERWDGGSIPSGGTNKYRMSIQIYQRDGHTMGDTLMNTSMFSSLKEPVVIHTSPNSWYGFWKRSLDIGPQLTVIEDVCQIEWPDVKTHPSWHSGFKVFNRYVEPKNICLWGQKFPTRRKNKKCAGILLTNGEHVKDTAFWETIDNPEYRSVYPYLKFIPKKHYTYINDLVMSAGYDPIVIDSRDIDLEHKLFVINEMCEFVIGYEGGIAHVAHALGIPSIIFPWRTPEPGSKSEAWLHLDKKTYFLDKHDDIFDWDVAHLNSIIKSLHNDQGNNYWINHPSFPDPAPLLDFVKHSNESFNEMVAWAREHIENPTLGGF